VKLLVNKFVSESLVTKIKCGLVYQKSCNRYVSPPLLKGNSLSGNGHERLSQIIAGADEKISDLPVGALQSLCSRESTGGKEI